jgi:hypothetical protein
MAGDQSMHDELDANAKSDSPIAQMARESLQEDYAVGFKRRREELELMRMEQDIKLRDQDIKVRDQEMRIKDELHRQQYYRGVEGDLKRIGNPENTSGIEERACLLLKDKYTNMLMGANDPPSASADKSSSPNKPISIASIAAELGYKPSTNDSKKIGKSIKKAYVKKYGDDPPKHEQICDGRVTRVNSYTERDRDLVEEALHAFFGKDSSVASNDSGF